MKRKRLLSGIRILFLCLFAFSGKVFGQGDVADLVQASPADATKLAGAYLNPLFKGIGFGMNSAWYNSAKTKNLGRFDLKIQATGAFVPTSDRSFDVRSLNLENIEPALGANPVTPTAFGKDETGAELQITDNNGIPIPTATFNMPSGLGYNIVPSPQVQLTVGLIKNTDLSLRFTPKVGGDDFGKLGSWGVGLKKEISTLLPGKTEKLLPVDISIAAGYNQINYDYEVPADEQSGGDANQRVEGQFSGFTVDAIVSKKLAVFTPFLSVGFNSAKTKLDMLGDYETATGEVFTDPIKIRQNDISGVRANVGFSLHLAFFRLYGAYSIGEYQAVSAGIGFGIGS